MGRLNALHTVYYVGYKFKQAQNPSNKSKKKIKISFILPFAVHVATLQVTLVTLLHSLDSRVFACKAVAHDMT